MQKAVIKYFKCYTFRFQILMFEILTMLTNGVFVLNNQIQSFRSGLGLRLIIGFSKHIL